jgi:hypothetical protein
MSRSELRFCDEASEQVLWEVSPGLPWRAPICRSCAVCVGGLTSVDAIAPCTASRFRAVQGLENKGRETGRRTAEYDNASVSWRAPLSTARSSCQYDPSSAHAVVVAVHHPGTTDQPGGDAGKLSTPAQVQCPLSPARHKSSADTKIRLLSQLEIGYHAPNPSSPSHH